MKKSRIFAVLLDSVLRFSTHSLMSMSEKKYYATPHYVEALDINQFSQQSFN